jgi:copper chaperone
MTATHAVLDVPAISCAHCKRAIEGAVGAVTGVSAVAVDVATRKVVIDYDADAVSLDALESAIREEGYEVAARQTSAG